MTSTVIAFENWRAVLGWKMLLAPKTMSYSHGYELLTLYSSRIVRLMESPLIYIESALYVNSVHGKITPCNMLLCLLEISRRLCQNNSVDSSITEIFVASKPRL